MSPPMLAGFLMVAYLGYTQAVIKTCVWGKGYCDTDKYIFCVEGQATLGGFGKYQIRPQSIATKPANIPECNGNDASQVDPNTLMCHAKCIINHKNRVGCFKVHAATPEEMWIPVAALTVDSDKKPGFLGSSYGVLSYETNKQALATSWECVVPAT